MLAMRASELGSIGALSIGVFQGLSAGKTRLPCRLAPTPKSGCRCGANAARLIPASVISANTLIIQRLFITPPPAPPPQGEGSKTSTVACDGTALVALFADKLRGDTAIGEEVGPGDVGGVVGGEKGGDLAHLARRPDPAHRHIRPPVRQARLQV